jgi:hypothetical protein
MSPTVFQYKEYRFYFFSREESRMHVHVYAPDGEAKFWLEPIVALAESYGFNAKQIKVVQKIVEERKNEIEKSWKKHFKH